MLLFFDIVAGMIMQQSLFKRALAVLLPVCFLWVFASCVMICTAHASEEQREGVSWLLNETSFLSETDCCPFSNSQLSELPNRRSPVPQVSSSQAKLSALFNEPLLHRLATFEHPSQLLPCSDSPFERSCTLRI